MRTGFLEKYGALLALIALLTFCIIRQPALFLSPENFRNLLNQNAYIGIVAAGMTLVISVGAIDLSVGSMLALASAVCLHTVNRMAAGSGEMNAVLTGAAAAIVTGGFLGILNGLLVTMGRIAPFVATLGGLAMFRSITLVSANGGEIRSASNTILPGFGQAGLPGLTLAGGLPIFTWATVIWLLTAVLFWFIAQRTRLGRHCIAVGTNERAARYSAVNNDRVKLIAFGLLGLVTGIASFIQVARLNSMSPASQGSLLELDAIAAVVIGGTSLAGGRSKMGGTVCGVLILGTINTMLVGEGISTYWQGFVKGAIILLAVLIQRTGKAPA